MVHKKGNILKRLAASFGILVALTAVAHAQPVEPNGTAIDRYEPPEPGDPFMAVPSPSIGGHLVPRLMLTYDVAYQPLEIEDASGEMQPLVWGMQVLHANASFALFDYLMLGVGMPFVLDQGPGFPSTTIDGTTYAMPSGADVGDLRAGLRGRFFGEYEDPFQIGAGTWVYFPTGPDQSYVSEGSVSVHPHLLLGGRARPFIWSAMAGSMIRTSDNPSAFTFGGAAGFIVFRDVLQFGPEVTGQVAFGDWELHPAGNATYDSVNTEILLSATANMFDMFTAGVAGGAGLTDGPGTPDGRALIRFGYAPTPAAERPDDADGDGIEDDVDACPDQPGVASEDADRHGCPPPADKDGDGILDKDDACPNRRGEASNDPAKNGCPGPQDRDGDSILDEDDACPDKAGEPSEDPIIHGCPSSTNKDDCVYEDEPCPEEPGPGEPGAPGEPGEPGAERPAPDRDKDGIPDKDDACPDASGQATSDPSRNGCPGAAPVPGGPSQAGKHPELEEIHVWFDLNVARLRPDSEAKLDALARYMDEHKEIRTVEVQGHADDTGPEGFNMGLSWARANSVRDALIKRGVAPQRLKPLGYGETTPLTSNDTEEGRQRNRRVQLVVKY